MKNNGLYTEMLGLVSNDIFYNRENIIEKKIESPFIFNNPFPTQNLILSNIFGRNPSNNSLNFPMPNKSESELSKIDKYSNQDFNTLNTISNQNMNEYYKSSINLDNNNTNKKIFNFNIDLNNDNKLFIDNNNNLLNQNELLNNNSSKINKSNSFISLMNDNMKLSYSDYFLKASANQDNYNFSNFNINNNIIQNDNNKKEKKSKKIITNKIIIKNNKNKLDIDDFDLLTYGHPQKIKYKSIKQILNIHKKLDLECRDDTFYLLHTIAKLQKILKNISKNGRIKNNNKYEELKKFFKNSVMNLQHKLYAQNILDRNLE